MGAIPGKPKSMDSTLERGDLNPAEAEHKATGHTAHPSTATESEGAVRAREEYPQLLDKPPTT